MISTVRARLDRPTRGIRVGLVLFGAALFALCFPPASIGLLGWVALVPFFLGVRGLRARHAALLGGLFGLVSVHLVFGWIFRFAAFQVHHGLLLGGYLGLYTAVFAVYAARWAFTPRGLAFVPAVAALVEWTRAHAGFLALPWASFGQTQHQNVALLQLAPLGGEPLVGIVVVAANVALAQLLVAVLSRPAPEAQRWPVTSFATLGLVLAAHAYGVVALARPEHGDTIVVAAVQPVILPNERDEAHQAAHFARLADLTRRAHEADARLVVWPETAVGNVEQDLSTKLAIRDVVEETGAPIVFGSSEVEKYGKPGTHGATRKNFNAAFVMEPGKPVPAPYRKVKLLPFAEYRPIDLPDWLAPRMFDTEHGGRHLLLHAGDVAVEPIICWENLFADDVRATATDEPTVIAHLVNDAWFGPTAQPELHNLVSRFRAAESHRPLVLASNAGPSIIVDARGRVLARAPHAFEPAVVTATVQMPGGQTPYRLWGDATWALPLAAVVAAIHARRRASLFSRPPPSHRARTWRTAP